MKLVQEITEWSVPTPNHQYVCNDSLSEIYGYIIAGTAERIMFKAPIKFDRRYRKFKTLENIADKQAGIEVKGSNGNSYFVTKQGSRSICTCPGFQFRGKCRHILEAEKV